DGRRHRSLAPALPPDADRTSARAERGEPVEELRFDLGAAEPLAGRREQLHRLLAGRASGLQQVLALGDEQALAFTRPPPLEAVDELELLVLWACDGHRKKKGRPLRGPPGESSYGCLRLGGGSLPGELDKSAEAFGVVDGDVGEHLAVHVDAGLVET